MKKTTNFLLMLCVLSSVALAGPSSSFVLIDGSETIYTEQKFSPLVFLNPSSRVLFDDPYGFYANGNIEQRNSNYAFTGEQIQWEVLVWDKNGVPEKINDVYAGWADQLNGPIDPTIQVNCGLTTQPNDGDDLANLGYPNVRRPGDQEAQQTFNSNTMGIYSCTLTIEASCHGQKWLGITAVDIDGLNGSISNAESWFCNPSLDLYISGEMNFGTLGPGEQGASTVSVENKAENGSGVDVVVSISGSDFYDPASSGGLCPTSNVLELQGDQTSFTHGFWYTATKGSMQTNGNKRIPYGNTLMDSDPIFSNSGQAQQWRRWTGGGSPSLMNQALSPGSELSLTMRLGIPQPCNGQFTDGQVTLWAWAI